MFGVEVNFKKESTLQWIREFYSSEDHVKSLREIGVDVDGWGTENFPAFSIEIIYPSSQNQPYTVSIFSQDYPPGPAIVFIEELLTLEDSDELVLLTWSDSQVHWKKMERGENGVYGDYAIISRFSEQNVYSLTPQQALSVACAARDGISPIGMPTPNNIW